MVKFNIIGNFFGCSGYNIHTRELANALDKQAETKISTHLPNGWETQVTDRELQMIKRQSTEDHINIIVALPNQWRLYTENKRNWAYCVWEGDSVPEHFIDEMLNPDIEYILVPSEHTKKAIVNTEGYCVDILDKIRVISHGVDLNKFYPKEKPKEFRFISNKGYRNEQDRGGIQYLIRAYLEEFTGEEDVELVLKVNPAYPIGDIQKVVSKYIKPNAPKISLNTENYPHEKLVDLYNKCHVFVCPTRSESFGLPMLEAMACGLPVITTSFGGQTDFVDNYNGWLIDGELTEVKHEIAYEGIKWLTPDIKELRNRMRIAFENKSLRDKKSIASLEDSKKFTWDNSAKQLINL